MKIMIEHLKFKDGDEVIWRCGVKGSFHSTGSTPEEALKNWREIDKIDVVYGDVRFGYDMMPEAGSGVWIRND